MVLRVLYLSGSSRKGRVACNILLSPSLEQLEVLTALDGTAIRKAHHKVRFTAKECTQNHIFSCQACPMPSEYRIIQGSLLQYR